MRIEGAIGGVDVLRGPRYVSINVNTPGVSTYRCIVYEANIKDDCLIGMDFLNAHGGSIDSKTKRVYLDPPGKCVNPHERIPCPFTFSHSFDVGRFTACKVYTVVRLPRAVEVQPFQNAICNANLLDTPDCDERMELAKVLRAKCIIEDGTLTEMDQNRGRPAWLWEADERSTPVVSSEREGSTPMECDLASPFFPCNERLSPAACRAPVQRLDATPTQFQDRGPDRTAGLSLQEETALGSVCFGLIVPASLLITRSCSFNVGMVPFATLSVELEITNDSPSLVTLPRNTVVAHVYPFFESDVTNQTSDLTVALVQNAVIQQIPPTDQADINKTPRLPPSPDNQPLPASLQNLADRCEGLTPQQKRQVEWLLRQHHDIFVKDDSDFGCCPWVKFKIDTGDHPPIKQQARPLALVQRKEVADLYRKYLEQGTCRPSQSPWASPILVVYKKTTDKLGKPEPRAVCDYRALNAVTRIPATPIPRTQELLEKLAGQKWYCHADLASGYHNLQIAEEDIPKTAIVLPDTLGLPSRHLEYTRMPFGLAAAPGVFQAVTDRLMKPSRHPTPDDDLGDAYGVYLDDICVGGVTFEDLFQRLIALFNRIHASGFLLKPKKCFLFKMFLEFLGFVLSSRNFQS